MNQFKVLRSSISDLRSKGVEFQPVMGANEMGISEKGATKSACFRDPAGNWMAINEGS